MFLFIIFPIALNSVFSQGKLKTTIFVALYLSFPIFIFTKKIKRYLLLLIPIIYFPYLSNLFHYFIYKESISKNGLIALFETNKEEAIGFILSYINLSIIVVSVIVILMFIIYFFLLKINDIDKQSKTFPFFQKLFFLLFLVGSIEGRFGIYSFHYRQILPSFFITSYLNFSDELELLRIAKKRQIKPFTDINSLFKDKKQTFVIVIGESADRDHYEIYGYNRKTNPLLSKRNDIYAFNNVKSPHAQTLLSLKKVLTFANFDDMSLLYTKGSIVNYFNDAGFKTFWLTKQENLSKHSTYTNIVAHEADIYKGRDEIQKFAGNKAENNDYILIYSLEEALKDKADKKVIFLHLQGSHSPYYEHVKKGCTPFTDGKVYNESMYKNLFSYKQQRRRETDQYDDTIVLNDLLLNTIIEMLKKQNDISYMLYFSDHGEDVRDAEKYPDSCYCHNDHHKNREYMLNVPFITWVSQKYKNLRPDFVNGFNKKLKNAYNTQHLIHSVMSLSGLTNSDIEKSKSIFD